MCSQCKGKHVGLGKAFLIPTFNIKKVEVSLLLNAAKMGQWNGEPVELAQYTGLILDGWQKHSILAIADCLILLPIVCIRSIAFLNTRSLCCFQQTLF